MKPTQSRAAGFTLIELLVVIAIIGVLSAALLPQVIESQEKADRTADKANLQKYHFPSLMNYKERKKGFRYGGSQFVLAPWVDGVVEHTQENFDRYWTPGLNDPERQYLLKDVGIENLWETIDDVQSTHTNYAGRTRDRLRGRLSGNDALMSNDNEFSAAFLDQTIHVLMGSGAVREIFLDDLRELGYDGDGKEDWFRVGPDSPHELLQQVDV